MDGIGQVPGANAPDLVTEETDREKYLTAILFRSRIRVRTLEFQAADE
jgi:hypothetical protein